MMSPYIKVAKALIIASTLTFSTLTNAAQFNQPSKNLVFDAMDNGKLYDLAQQGNKDAQFFLGRRLHKGYGVERNTIQAIEWYTRSANNGAVPAQLNLGLIYVFGEGISANESKARYWLEKAASGGDNRASFTLAMLDEKQRKLVDAYKWYELSTRDGMLSDRVKVEARDKIGKLAMNLSSEDINNARTLADGWLQNH